MKVGIMQPYFFPYIGYFQLIQSVDKMVIYDNIKYTKKGWFNRNRYLLDGKDKYFTIPIEKDSDFLDVNKRKLSNNFDHKKIKNQIHMAYKNAPFFDPIYPFFCSCIEYDDNNLFNYIFYSLVKILNQLEITTELIISSSIDIDHKLQGEDKVLAICQKLGADEYINLIGGKNLYNKERFKSNGIELNFIETDPKITYTQFGNPFVPALSILDVLMFNSIEDIRLMLDKYQIK